MKKLESQLIIKKITMQHHLQRKVLEVHKGNKIKITIYTQNQANGRRDKWHICNEKPMLKTFRHITINIEPLKFPIPVNTPLPRRKSY